MTVSSSQRPDSMGGGIVYRAGPTMRRRDDGHRARAAWVWLCLRCAFGRGSGGTHYRPLPNVHRVPGGGGQSVGADGVADGIGVPAGVAQQALHRSRPGVAGPVRQVASSSSARRSTEVRADRRGGGPRLNPAVPIPSPAPASLRVQCDAAFYAVPHHRGSEAARLPPRGAARLGQRARAQSTALQPPVARRPRPAPHLPHCARSAHVALLRWRRHQPATAQGPSRGAQHRPRAPPQRCPAKQVLHAGRSPRPCHGRL